MRLWSLILICALSAPSFALAQADPKAEVRALLVKVSDQFQEALAGISEQQWNYKAPTQKHAIGALAEHAALSANDLQKMVQRALEAGPNPELAATLTGQTKVVRDVMLSVEQPPENFRPSGRLVTKADIDEYFPQARTKALYQLDSAKYLELSVARHPSKRIRDLTGVQWFYYIAYLLQAHTEQIGRIKADPGYPKS
ncbi:MAG: DinB family protein [Acidobacteria bacterium]|nr:DinB family protein [Acidobacteriota bacterium]MDA1236913.1 DinB family protein [Acidobacteriota bacterium]